MAFKAEILKDSINSFGHRITTFQVSFPRIILAEANTHRVFSRNYSSSRAIPVNKFIYQLLEDPFIPVYWGKAQKGMGASEEIPEEDKFKAKDIWLKAMRAAIDYANDLLSLGVAKEITNRLLEPWMWVTGIITATEFENFFALRRSPFAQPEIKKIADMMYEAYQNSVPTLLGPCDWHIPMLMPEDAWDLNPYDELKVATGRLARVSFLTHDGQRNPNKDIELHDGLLINRHLSPFEHCAKNMEDNKTYGNFIGWQQYRKLIPGESGSTKLTINPYSY